MVYEFWQPPASPDNPALHTPVPYPQAQFISCLSCISLHPHPLAFCAELTAAFLHFHECTELLPGAHTLHMLFPLRGTKPQAPPLCLINSSSIFCLITPTPTSQLSL